MDMRDSVKSANSISSFKSYITAENNAQDGDLAVEEINVESKQE